jgi:hypothetical protein
VISAIDPPYRPGYIASNVLLAEGVVQEALDREQYDEKNPISLETYLTTRRKSIGILPFHDLARWALKLDFPDGSHVLENPHIQLMVQASVDLVLLANVRNSSVSFRRCLTTFYFRISIPIARSISKMGRNTTT